MPKWVATDAFFKALFEDELSKALERQTGGAYTRIETYKDTLKSSWRKCINEQLDDDQAERESDGEYQAKLLEMWRCLNGRGPWEAQSRSRRISIGSGSEERQIT